MLRWLFHRPVTRERAIQVATDLLAANECCVVASEADVDWAGDHIPYLFLSASKPGRRWYVEFVRVVPPNMWMSNTHLTVYVWVDTGHATSDHFDGWQ